ncbi:MAG: hypothetical protein POELPBGB_00805 [Bacteroidia bacterium]|nr:hypothetical protein [Bacteroidia bacterium]
MSEWKEYKVEEIADVIGGGTPKTEIREYWNGNIPWITPRDLSNFKGKYIQSGERKISNIGLENSNAKLLPEGTVLLSSRAPIGYLAIAKNPVTTNQGFQSLVPKQNTTTQFLFYLFKNNVDYLISQGSGTTFGELSKSTLKQLVFKLPPLPEQKSIAEILSSLDDKIDLLHRQNKTLEQLSETLFRQWFVEEAEDSWEITTLEKNTEVFRGLSYKGSGLTIKGSGLPMHNLNSVYEGGGYKYEGIKYYKGDFRDRHLIAVGDIIITNTEQGHELRLIGYPAIVPDSFGEKGLFSQHIYKLAPLQQTYLSREFIYYLLMTPFVREQITAATNGSTVNMLAIDGLQRPEFKLPPKEKVVKFTTIVKDYWTKKNVNQNQITTLTQLRDTLLPKLMSGEVRIKIN